MMLFCKNGNILQYCSATLLERKFKHPKPIIIVISFTLNGDRYVQINTYFKYSFSIKC